MLAIHETNLQGTYPTSVTLDCSAALLKQEAPTGLYGSSFIPSSQLVIHI